MLMILVSLCRIATVLSEQTTQTTGKRALAANEDAVQKTVRVLLSFRLQILAAMDPVTARFARRSQIHSVGLVGW